MSTARKPDARATCPLCRKAMAAAEFSPFCSARCRDRDLLNWLGDGYRIPGPPADPETLAETLDTRREPPL